MKSTDLDLALVHVERQSRHDNLLGGDGESLGGLNGGDGGASLACRSSGGLSEDGGARGGGSATADGGTTAASLGLRGNNLRENVNFPCHFPRQGEGNAYLVEALVHSVNYRGS